MKGVPYNFIHTHRPLPAETIKSAGLDAYLYNVFVAISEGAVESLMVATSRQLVMALKTRDMLESNVLAHNTERRVLP